MEICLSSNILCKTVQSLDAHHIRQYLAARHPIAICTDDPLPFLNSESVVAEYALAERLGLTEEEAAELSDSFCVDATSRNPCTRMSVINASCVIQLELAIEQRGTGSLTLCAPKRITTGWRFGTNEASIYEVGVFIAFCSWYQVHRL